MPDVHLDFNQTDRWQWVKNKGSGQFIEKLMYLNYTSQCLWGDGWTAVASSSGHCEMSAEKRNAKVWPTAWENPVSCDFSFG